MRHVCLIMTLLPAPVHAACEMDGTRKACVPNGVPSRPETTPNFLSAPAAEPGPAPGVRLPSEAQTVIGTEYLGLPPAQNGRAYARVGRPVYKADFQTRRVIARVSP